MKILVIGGGGREHALAWKAAQSRTVEKVYVAPGNAGTALEPGIENVTIDPRAIGKLLDFARNAAIDLSIVGPEAPLVAGIVDTFTAAGLRCFGPSRGAAQLEGSKAFSKAFLQRHSIPTASYQTFTETPPALDYIRRRGAPIVIKADGLAAGKGVVLAATIESAEAAVHNMLSGKSHGEAGRRIVVESMLEGEEASFIAVVDGTQVLPMATSQDHKARDEGDRGPNTGGMGAYSPAPVVTTTVHQRIMDEVMLPTVRGMAAEGYPYTGFLYAGVMISADGTPNVLEYNCRFGDPETQPIMMRLESDLIELCEAALDSRLAECELHWRPLPALGVVMAAGGYPGDYRQGDPISGLHDAEHDGVKVFHAGTRLHRDSIVTAGGRVLCVTALGENIADARDRAYRAVDKIHWRNAYCRRDIGFRAVARMRS